MMIDFNGQLKERIKRMVAGYVRVLRQSGLGAIPRALAIRSWAIVNVFSAEGGSIR